ncbi:MAG: ChuX/HutX family heme-like substrate-binding protein, partial [Spirochaetota bacterium]
PEVHLHIRETHLAEAWVVRKPTEQDTVTSVEIYSNDGRLALQLFGVRGEAGREDPRWREIAESQAR